VKALDSFAGNLRPWAERLDALALRERGLIFGACVTLAYLSWQTLLMGPLNVRAQQAEQRLSVSRQHMAAIEQAGSMASADPVVGAAARNQALKGRLAALDNELRSAAQGYVAPDRMTDLLRAILAGQRGLKLVSLANLPVVSLSQAPSVTAGAGNATPGAGSVPAGAVTVGAAPAANDRGPFLHPVEMVVEGDYASVVTYLRALEVLPWRIHWQQLELVAGDYPVSRVRIVIGALSLSADWLSV
jgi:MSHA biogenesis protein MshJ